MRQYPNDAAKSASVEHRAKNIRIHYTLTPKGVGLYILIQFPIRLSGIPVTASPKLGGPIQQTPTVSAFRPLAIICRRCLSGSIGTLEILQSFQRYSQARSELNRCVRRFGAVEGADPGLRRRNRSAFPAAWRCCRRACARPSSGRAR